MKLRGEALNPTVMAKGDLCLGCVSLHPFIHSPFFFFVCQLTHPFQESLVLMIFLCNCFPSKMPKLGLSNCKLVQDIAKGPP